MRRAHAGGAPPPADESSSPGHALPACAARRAAGLPARQGWSMFSSLLDEVLELDAPARQRRLARIEREAPRLAADLRAALHAAQRADAEDFLAGTLLAGLPSPGLTGRRIGAYHIESELGSGGTGSVWLARRVEGSGEALVAIKLLHPSLLGQLGAARFAQEGDILSRLAHPGIARLLDVGTSREGQPYLVLEHVDGLPIDRYCDAHALSLEGRLRLVAQLMEALMHAHGHGLVHRDIKPANILVTPTGQVKLLDFGIAKRLADATEEGGPVTVQGYPVLTPRYAAPEQLRGEPASVATDVYAVSVLLFELLCGRSPSGSAASVAAVVRAATLARPPSMRAALLHDRAAALDIAAARGTTLARLRGQLRGDLQNIVSMAMRPHAAERYASVWAFAADVQRYLRGQPVLARRDGLFRRLLGLVRRCFTSGVRGLAGEP